MADPGERGQAGLRHDERTYERPDMPYRCGRAAVWGMPCWQGPDRKGVCGGAAQCVPARRGDRWECRRPSHGGGPCEQGPLPDGSCCLVRPACQPVPSSRRWRGRLTWLAVMLMVAVIAAFSNTGPHAILGIAAMDAGPLTSSHAGFIGARNCGACHSGHDSSGLDWLAEVVRPHDNDARCLECHTFGGPARLAHNRPAQDTNAVPQPSCGSCHAEHQGAEHDLSAVADVTCGNCHQQRFESFADGHPDFSPDFPGGRPGRIYFDHVRHLSVHFPELIDAGREQAPSDFAGRALRSCEACHAIAADTREVSPRPYQQTCAACHDEQIRERPLAIMMAEETTPYGALLLGMDYDDEALYDRGVEVREAMAEEGLAPLLEALQEWQPPDGAVRLLAGLPSELVQTAARAWLDEAWYEAPQLDGALAVGWTAGEDASGDQTLRYRPTGHGDSLLRAWYDFATTTARTHPEEAHRAAARASLEWLADASDGPGACGKCHIGGIDVSDAASGQASEPAGGDSASAVQWGREAVDARPYVHYSHAPHLQLLGSDDGCRTCHRLNTQADFASYYEGLERDAALFRNGFAPIARATCEGCHKPGKVRFDCTLCHTYHREPGFHLGSANRSVARRVTPPVRN